MKAVGFQQPGLIERQDALQDITLEKPVAHGRDLLVEIKAVYQSCRHKGSGQPSTTTG
jgi:NADPH:quinone reductase